MDDRRPGARWIRFFVVVALLAAGTCFVGGRVNADELTSADWNWKNHSGRAICGRSTVHAPGGSYSTSRSLSWQTTSTGDCDAAKANGYSLASVITYAWYDHYDAWLACDAAAGTTWGTSQVRIAQAGPEGCPPNYVVGDFLGASWYGNCVQGTCWFSGTTQPGGPDNVCPLESSIVPLPTGKVHPSCDTLDYYPHLSPTHPNWV